MPIKFLLGGGGGFRVFFLEQGGVEVPILLLRARAFFRLSHSFSKRFARLMFRPRARGFAQVLKAFPSERRIYESTLVGQTKVLS